MKIKCCNEDFSTDSETTFDCFEKHYVRKADIKKALEQWCKLENAMRKHEGKTLRDLEYYTQRAGKEFDRLNYWTFVCSKNGCFKIFVEYRKKLAKNCQLIDMQELNGAKADIFLCAVEEFATRVKLKLPGQPIYICKHPVTFPLATSPITQGEHWLPLCLGIKNGGDTVFKSEVKTMNI